MDYVQQTCRTACWGGGWAPTADGAEEAQTSDRAPEPGIREKMVLEGHGALSPRTREGTAAGEERGTRQTGQQVPGRSLAHPEAVGSHRGFRVEGEGCPGQKGQLLAWGGTKLREMQKQPQCPTPGTVKDGSTPKSSLEDSLMM